eukprot:scaffold32185_cov45-Attheya_sp.AAC.1
MSCLSGSTGFFARGAMVGNATLSLSPKEILGRSKSRAPQSTRRNFEFRFQASSSYQVYELLWIETEKARENQN